MRVVRLLVHLPVAVRPIRASKLRKRQVPNRGHAEPGPHGRPHAHLPLPTPNLPGMASCSRIGLGHDGGNLCDMRGPTFQDDVVQAIHELQNQQPRSSRTAGRRHIKSPGQFYVGLSRSGQEGLCAGSTAELQVKPATSSTTNTRSALRAASCAPTRRSTARPPAAAFPTPLPPFPPSNGCKLASSLELTCTRETSSYYPDIERSIDDVMRTRPELFDFTVHATGATWPGVKDFHAYHEAIAQSMIAKGYCARFDGEEIVAKKENKFSEHFDVFLGEGFVRRGEGIYRSTCYPAAF